MIETTDAKTLSGFVRKVVSDKADLVATDEHGGYHYLNALGFKHESIAHSVGEYVRGEVHTNSIESFWALLKRGINRDLPSRIQEVFALVPRGVSIPP
jgi:hypothetical protein